MRTSGSDSETMKYLSPPDGSESETMKYLSPPDAEASRRSNRLQLKRTKTPVTEDASDATGESESLGPNSQTH
jgi:hypothetical protein